MQWRVGALVKLFTVLIVNHSVPVGEGAAPAVLTTQTHRVTTGNQGRERHVFTHAPIDRNITAPHGSAVGIDLLHQLVRRDGRRQRGEPLGQAFPLGRRQRRVTGIGPLLADVGGPVDSVFALEIRQYRVKGVLARVQRGARGLHHVLAQRGTQALRCEPLGVQPACARMLRDLLVHQRLG